MNTLLELHNHVIHPDEKLTAEAQKLDEQFIILARREDQLMDWFRELEELEKDDSELQRIRRLLQIYSEGMISGFSPLIREQELCISKNMEYWKKLRRESEELRAQQRAAAKRKRLEELKKQGEQQEREQEREQQRAANLEFWERKKKEEAEQRERQLAAKRKRLEDLKKQREQQERDAAMEREI
ncbi:hypothetical protein, partial [Butyricicoccus sp.]|uniref:hypothetical protein n=1 Tax=Butyricicoccus sp. TaxID=2049021 RepID=UPI003F172CC7